MQSHRRSYHPASLEASYPDDFAGPHPDTQRVDTHDWPVKKGKQPRAEQTQNFVLSERINLRVKTKTLFVGLSTLCMFLLLIIPIWNCLGLLEDPLYSYMASSTLPTWLLACCILLFLISYLTLKLFLSHSRPEMRNEQSMLMIAGIFLSTLGIVLILFGGPLGKQAMTASDEFFSNCRDGQRTGSLYVASEELESLRKMPHCITQQSIEDCNGYQAYPNTRAANVLKEMETRFLCSGLCQGKNKTDGKQIYPPTLFNRANYTLSCDGMAGRHMKKLRPRDLEANSV